MRVCMLLHKSVEFDSRVRREARALADAGHEVVIVHLAGDGVGRAGLPPAVTTRSALPPASTRSISDQVYTAAFVANFVRRAVEARPDVVHAHDAAMLIPALAAARITRARLVYDSHELATGVPYRSPAAERVVRSIEGAIVPRCDAVLTVSDGIADRVRELYGLRERPAVVRNVTDLDPPAAGTGGKLRGRLGIGDAPLVLHQGALSTGRGGAALVEAVAQLDGVHAVFLGTGDAPDEAETAGRAAALGVADRVHILPSVPLDELLESTQDADVGVSLLADNCENHRLALPNKVFEYVAAGVPVVVSDLPELRALVTSRDIGWTVKPDDPADIARGLREALAHRGDPALDARLADAAGELSWKHERERLVALYDRLGSRSTDAAPRAVAIVRNTFTHDARVLREAKLLQALGYDASVLAVVSTLERERRFTIEGVPVVRLEPTSPFAVARSLLRRRHTNAGAGETPSASPPLPSAPSESGSLARGVVRIHRWLTTLDYYRRGIGAMRALRPEVVHCNDYNTMWIGIAARFLGASVVYDAHELWPDRNGRREPRAWLLACEALFVRAADGFVTASPAYAREMARRYRVAEPVVVRNIPAASSRQAEAVARSRNGQVVAGYVGAQTRHRGLEESIAAVARVPELRLRLIGPGNEAYRAELEELIARMGVADRVEMPPPVAPEAVVDTLRDLDIGLALIQPACLSYELTLPNKLFEYVGANVPVLASDLPAIAEFVNGYGVGVTVRPDDIDDIATGLRRLLDPAMRERLREATVRAAGELSWDLESERLAGVYRDVARRRRRGPAATTS